MSRIDYYRMLSVSKNATIAQIKTAYRKLALQYHPDTCTTDKKTAETIFKNITLAYQVLSNVDKKSEYDRSIANYSHSATSNKYSGARNTVRDTTNGENFHISRDRFNVDEWNAYHYGEDDEEPVVVVRRTGWVDPTNKHQSYYRRKHSREATGGEKWNADTAYQKYSGNSTDPKRSTGPNYTQSRAANRRSVEEMNAVEQALRMKTAMGKLNKSRTERKEREKQSEQTNASINNSNNKPESSDSCTIS